MTNKLSVLSKRLVVSILVFALSALSLPSEAAKQRYVAINPISGINPNLQLEINTKSVTLDLTRTANIRVRIRTSDLFTSLENQSSIRINLYDVSSGTREFITAQDLTLNRGSRKRNRVISMSAGRFTTDSKQVEFDVFDTEGNLINVYATTINAINIGAQTSSNPIDFTAATCTDASDIDCLIQGIFERVTFEARKQTQASTRFERFTNGRFKVTVPVPRQSFNFLRGARGGATDGGSGGGGGGQAALFGENIDGLTLRLGPSQNPSTPTNYSFTTYNDAVGRMEFGFVDGGTNLGTKVVLTDNGRLGVGITAPQAYLHLRSSSNSPTTPSLIIEPGTLTTAIPPNGSIEFDGTDIYLTKGGVRAPLAGTKGDKGDKGDTGAPGAPGTNGINGTNGLQGPAGTITANSGGFINGNLLVNGNIQFTKNNVFNISNARLIRSQTFNGSVFNGGVFRGAFSGNGAGLTNIPATAIVGLVTSTSVTNSTINNNLVNGALTFNNNGSLFNAKLNGTTTVNGKVLFANNTRVGSFTTNGAVTVANGNLTVASPFRFIGNGSGLTNIASSSIIGSVSNASTASVAGSAINATNATNLIGSGVVSGTHDVTGALSFSTGSLQSAKFSNPVASDLTVASGFRFAGNGSGLTNIPASAIVGGTFNGATINGTNISTSNFSLNASTVTVNPAIGLKVTSAIMRVIGLNAGPNNITFSPQITNGAGLALQDGQFLIIRGTDNTNRVTFEDGNGVSLNAGVAFTMGNNDTLTLIYDAVATQWVEISRSDR